VTPPAYGSAVGRGHRGGKQRLERQLTHRVLEVEDRFEQRPPAVLVDHDIPGQAVWK